MQRIGDNWIHIMLTVALCLSGSPRVEGQSTSLSNALDMYEAASAKISSYDVLVTDVTRLFINFELVGTPEVPSPTKPGSVKFRTRLYRDGEAPKPRVSVYRQTYQSGRVRIDTLDRPGGAVIHSVVSDGEIERVLDPKGRTAAIRPEKMDWFPPGVDYRCGFLNFLGNTPLIGCLRGRTNAKCWIEDGLCHVESAGQPNARSRLPACGVHVSFDPVKGFLPVMIEEFETKNDRRVVRWHTDIVAFAQIPGSFVPVGAVTKAFDCEERDTFGQAISERVTTVDVAHSKWNVRIADDRFDLPIPAGIKLFDETRNLRIITGRNDPGKNMDSLVANAKEVFRYQPMAPAALPRSYTWIWSLGGLVMIFVTGVAIIRRRKK